MTHHHLDQSTLDKLTNGGLSDQEIDAILIDAADCDECMEKIDQMWQTTNIGLMMSRVSEPNAEQAQQMEDLLLRRIHRSNFGQSIVSFGLGGFSNVLMAFLRPFLSQNAPPTHRRGDTPHD